VTTLSDQFCRVKQLVFGVAICAALAWPAKAADAPEGWDAFKITDKKKLTRYRLVEEAGRCCTRAPKARRPVYRNGAVQPRRAPDPELALEGEPARRGNRQQQVHPQDRTGDDRVEVTAVEGGKEEQPCEGIPRLSLRRATAATTPRNGKLGVERPQIRWSAVPELPLPLLPDPSTSRRRPSRKLVHAAYAASMR
jgi:hypothetical protein